MNDRVIAARATPRKATPPTSMLVIPEQGCLGVVSGRDVQYFNAPLRRHTIRSEFRLDPGQAALPPVDILYDYQGRHPPVPGRVASRCAWHRVGGTGNGSLSPAALAGARLAVGQGVAFVRASRVGQDRCARLSGCAPRRGRRAVTQSSKGARASEAGAALQPRDRDALQLLFDEY